MNLCAFRVPPYFPVLAHAASCGHSRAQSLSLFWFFTGSLYLSPMVQKIDPYVVGRIVEAYQYSRSPTRVDLQKTTFMFRCQLSSVTPKNTMRRPAEKLSRRKPHGSADGHFAAQRPSSTRFVKLLSAVIQTAKDCSRRSTNVPKGRFIELRG